MLTESPIEFHIAINDKPKKGKGNPDIIPNNYIKSIIISANIKIQQIDNQKPNIVNITISFGGY